MNPQDQLDQAITHALEAVPQVEIADDFALRVLSRLPAKKLTRIAPPAYLPAHPSVGRRVAFVAAAVLFVAMLAFAMQPGIANQFIRISIAGTCAAEFILVTVWLALRPQPLR